MKRIHGIIGGVALLGVAAGIFLYSRSQSNGPSSSTGSNAAFNPESETSDDSDTETIEDTNRVVAKVGNFESRFYRNITDLGGAHPEVVNYYEVVDLTTKKPVKASDVFGEPAMIAAFAKAIEDEAYSSDADSKKSFESLRASKNLNELNRGLSSLEVSTAFSLGDHCDGESFVFEPDTENFAIVGYDPATSQVAVHIGISATSHACDSAFPRLKLQMAAPPTLKAALQKATDGSDGFLPKPESLKACDSCEPVDFTKVGLIGG